MCLGEQAEQATPEVKVDLEAGRKDLLKSSFCGTRLRRSKELQDLDLDQETLQRLREAFGPLVVYRGSFWVPWKSFAVVVSRRRRKKLTAP